MHSTVDKLARLYCTDEFLGHGGMGVGGEDKGKYLYCNSWLLPQPRLPGSFVLQIVKTSLSSQFSLAFQYKNSLY